MNKEIYFTLEWHPLIIQKKRKKKKKKHPCSMQNSQLLDTALENCLIQQSYKL